MKKIVIILFSLIPTFISAQNVSMIDLISIGNKYSLEKINTAFDQTNLCGYFNSNNLTQLILDDSTVIVLKKKSDLEAIGITLAPECFDIKNFQPDSEIWSIKDSYLVCEKKRINIKF